MTKLQIILKFNLYFLNTIGVYNKFTMLLLLYKKYSIWTISL